MPSISAGSKASFAQLSSQGQENEAQNSQVNELTDQASVPAASQSQAKHAQDAAPRSLRPYGTAVRRSCLFERTETSRCVVAAAGKHEARTHLQGCTGACGSSAQHSVEQEPSHKPGLTSACSPAPLLC